MARRLEDLAEEKVGGGGKVVVWLTDRQKAPVYVTHKVPNPFPRACKNLGFLRR